MSRLKKDKVVEREQFMSQLLAAEPGLSMPNANTKFAEKFGSRMRPQRFYELRNSVQAQLERGVAATAIEIPPAAPVVAKVKKPKSPVEPVLTGEGQARVAEMSERPAVPAPVQEMVGIPHLLQVGIGHEAAVAKAIEELHSGTVDFQGRGYVLVTTPAE